MTRFAAALAAALLLGAPGAQAMTLDWRLSDLDGVDLGGFRLDFDAAEVIDPMISGSLGQYTVATSFVFLGDPDTVAGERVEDFLLIFSDLSGQVFFTDFGGGESSTIRINEAAIRIGTLGTPLGRDGGVFPVIVQEVQDFDETFSYCGVFEEIYDDDTGEIIFTGRCLEVYSDTSFNVGVEDVYFGFLTATPRRDAAEVPAPPALALLGLGAAALAGLRRRRR